MVITGDTAAGTYLIRQEIAVRTSGGKNDRKVKKIK